MVMVKGMMNWRECGDNDEGDNRGYSGNKTRYLVRFIRGTKVTMDTEIKDFERKEM